MTFDITRWDELKCIAMASHSGRLVSLDSQIYNCPITSFVFTLVEKGMIPVCLEAGLELLEKVKGPGVDYNSTLVSPWATRKVLVRLEPKKEK